MGDETATFQRYHDEFQSIVEKIQSNLTASSSLDGDDWERQCDDLLKQMALEARSQPNPSNKTALMQRVRQCKSKLSTLQQKAEKQSLMPSSTKQTDNRLLQANEDSLASQNETLERARRTMQESETVALEITEELGNHRETLLSAHGRVREVSGLTGRARRILTSMNRRQVQQKLVLYGVAVGLVFAFLILMWAMWRA